MSEQMQPGPELDAAVAERVMGWTLCKWGDPCQYGNWETSQGMPRHLLLFSTDWAAAGQVVERLIAEGWDFKLAYYRGGGGAWLASFFRDLTNPKHKRFKSVTKRAKIAPHAICLAALAAMEAAR